MASAILSWLSFLLITLGVLGALFVNPSCSTSRRALDLHDHGLQVQSGFKVTLKHVDSGKNLTRLERLQRRIKRGRKRLQRLNAMKLKSSTSPDSHTQVETPVHAGLGEFLMTLSVGTPAKSFSAIVDTGSDLIWTQCEPCKQCYKQPTPIFNPKESSTFSKVSCTSELCDALPSSKCTNKSCEYYYTYGDSSSTDGILATETFSFGDEDSSDVSIPKISFGCGGDNEGGGFNQGAGLVGLGRGTLRHAKYEHTFDGSLASLNSSTSSSDVANIKTTPLIKNPSQPTFYYLSLEGITVGGTRLPIAKDTFTLGDDGGGGLIIDSGTTLTYLAEDAYDAVVKEFTSQMELREKDAIDTVGLDLCFELPEDATKVEVPKLVFHFKDADLELPSENYMIADSDVGVICLAAGSAGDMSVFGNYQQQNMLVLHDLVKETISFVPTKCDQL
ncbi:putative nepenthesin [Rosa chinensis]|uniref:Putative nepenthesin n=1 Tax=Rosa chinensis TaxID=74649 RepID=A0A2P6RFE6_ROSCH|nr:putative nepenthesin [Rosa chinensis]